MRTQAFALGIAAAALLATGGCSKQDGKSGHIVAVVPETTEERAVRNAAGEVTKPLQSQAGMVNFRRGTSTLNWWKGDQFAESAFWLHA